MKKNLLNGLLSIMSFIYLFIAIVLIYFTSNYGLTIVDSSSMAKTINEGDLVVYKKTNKIKDMDIVIVNTSHIDDETVKMSEQIIKRYYEEKSTSGIYLLGDNSEQSRDSRWFGEVPKESVVGVAVMDVSKENQFIGNLIKKLFKLEV